MGTVQVRTPGTPEVEEEQSHQAAGPSLPFPALLSLPGASFWGHPEPLKSITGEHCGPMCSVGRSHQLPCGPEEGRPTQEDRLVAVAVPRWQRVRCGLGMAGHGNRDKELGKQNGGLVRGGRMWRRTRSLGLLWKQANVGEVKEERE